MEEEWALSACAADPAMHRAFLEAGGTGGWVSGPALRAYCEREGLMRVSKGGPGVAKSALAQAWDLADVSRDERGLSFDEFCVFMHLLCIATAGGALPTSLPEELRPPPPQRSDEMIARALQDAYDDELKEEAQAEEVTEVHVSDGSGGYRFEADALRDLVLAQGGGLLELDGTLFACDEAMENERWSPGKGFGSEHLLATDVAAWSSEDGSVSSSDREVVAPSRDATWQLISDWRVHLSAATDRYGWAYCRGLPSPLAPGAPFALSAAPFAGAVARRRRWTRVSSRPLLPGAPSRAPKKNPGAETPLLARLQESFKSGVVELNRRLSGGKEGAAPPQPSLISDGSARWQSSPAAPKCRAAISAFCRAFPSDASDEARAAEVKRFLAQCAATLRSRDRAAARDDDLFETVFDHLEADLYRALREQHDLVLETAEADRDLAAKLEKLQAVTPDMLDAVDVQAMEPHWPRAIDSIRSIAEAPSPKRKVRRVRAAVDDIYECLARRARERDRGDAVPPGADDLLPLVILATLRARPPNLLAHLKFVELFGDDRLSGEDFFLLTQIAAAASFLHNVDATQLKGVTPEAFDCLMRGDLDAFDRSVRNTSAQDLLLLQTDNDGVSPGDPSPDPPRPDDSPFDDALLTPAPPPRDDAPDPAPRDDAPLAPPPRDDAPPAPDPPPVDDAPLPLDPPPLDDNPPPRQQHEALPPLQPSDADDVPPPRPPHQSHVIRRLVSDELHPSSPRFTSL